MESREIRPEDRRWLDEPANVEWIFRGLLALCAVLVVGDLFYSKHVHYGFEGLFGFHGVYGFVSCWLLVVAAKQLRRWVLRDERYYGEDPDD